jgi:hypothetical protein
MTRVSLRVAGAPNVASLTRKSLGGRLIDGELVVPSMLGKEASLNEHLVWLWGFLKHERRYLKSLQSEGAKLIVEANVGNAPIEILPNGAELLHLLGAKLVVERHDG